jgi:hypothetical protein
VAFIFTADDHETDYEFGGGSDDDEQLVDGEPRYNIVLETVNGYSRCISDQC